MEDMLVSKRRSAGSGSVRWVIRADRSLSECVVMKEARLVVAVLEVGDKDEARPSIVARRHVNTRLRAAVYVSEVVILGVLCWSWGSKAR